MVLDDIKINNKFQYILLEFNLKKIDYFLYLEYLSFILLILHSEIYKYRYSRSELNLGHVNTICVICIY